ncbi:MAG: hypothetical protein K8R58_15595 [Bacteroidales bacterium]|nr:hypothetical protein [Bacteroidales bacterium]
MLKKEKYHKLFESFNNYNVLIIGDVMVDSYLWGDVERISPEAPVPIVTVKKRENRLGGAANVALNIKALGARPILCSVIGNELKGNEFLELLKNESLDTKGICRSNDRITTTKFRVIGNNTQMLRVDEEIDTELNATDLIKISDKIKYLLENEKIDIIIFQDYDKGIITPDLIEKVTSLANKINIPVVVDPKKNNFNAYKNITLFKPNIKELKEGLKIDFDSKNKDELTEAVSLLQNKHNIATVMVTLSEDGVLVSYYKKNEKHIKYIPAHIRSISDVSGAGDTVISVASLCLVSRLPTPEIASISNLAGGLVCEEVGVVPINKEKLLNEILKFQQ